MTMNPAALTVFHTRILLLSLAGLAAALPAQGIRWTDTQVAPTLHVRELANGDWMLCYDGWSTNGPMPLGGSDQAAAVGVDHGARTVRSTESDFIRGGVGGAATEALWFPFTPDATVDALFAARVGAPIGWYGFRAPIGSVPDHDMGALSFRVPLLNGARLSVASFLPGLATTYVGAARVDAQGRPTGAVFIQRVGAPRLADICFYKFDRGAGNLAINYAGVEGGALAVGSLSRPSGSSWAQGRLGDHALAAGATCDTGYRGDLGGRFSVAWFMRQRAAPTAVSPVFALGAWRCFTGGAAGTGLRCVGWGGALALDLNDDIQALAANGWVHIALVVDADTREALWYVNGAMRQRIALPAMVSVPAGASALQIGTSNGQPCVYDLDEFRLSAAAIDAPTVQAWSSVSPAAAQPFSAACGANLRHRGAPMVGATFDYRIEATPGAAAALFLTATPRAPLDLGLLHQRLAGCLWHSDIVAPIVVVSVPASGVAVLPIAIPNAPELRGLELFNQAIVVEPGRSVRATNAHAISLR